MPPYDHVVLLGRFQPVHDGHAAALRRALALGREVVVLIGSADAPVSARDPFSFDERAAMLRAAAGADAGRLSVRPVVDHLYNEDAWRAEVQTALAGPAGSVALIGREGADAWRDAFPKWAKVDLAPVEAPSADDLRRQLFSDDPEALKGVLPAAVLDLLHTHRTSDAFAYAAEEWRQLEAYRQAWSVAPYPPVFVTVDSVVVCDAHLLLVERAGQPGRGLWALPGGFLDPDETTLAAAVREVGEETGLAADMLEGALVGREVFDAPDRSLRERTVTHAFRFDLPPQPLPTVAGADDAAQARWIPLAEVRRMRGRMFEDHYFIVERLLGLA
ncbi:NUDIX domain-containing protein [Caulobacter sp. 17J80-11]|uniref:NUDIX domain-containing protein n=1 Tax=Caulobacter sp. 17J80-11 TaxID=2763502 RepID=UPI001653B4DA|nr:NUDIX domain-containing protein [Caulobacter sp. 17J80-11]MBC6982743.1 NUDIX domain-containing protein [Caulobacter sp. 17J80-11]